MFENPPSKKALQRFRLAAWLGLITGLPMLLGMGIKGYRKHGFELLVDKLVILGILPFLGIILVLAMGVIIIDSSRHLKSDY